MAKKRKADTPNHDQNGSKSEPSAGEAAASSTAAPETAHWTSQLFTSILDNFAIQLTFRITYIIASSYGTYAMIKEQTGIHFHGWTALSAIVAFVINALLALVASNREIRNTWTVIRSFTSWPFLYAFYDTYPQQCIRLAATSISAVTYEKYFGWNRTASLALAATISLIILDVETVRQHTFVREHKGKLQIALACLGIASYGGWKVYRWPALYAAYIANMALLKADFQPAASILETHQLWIATASMPMMILGHALHADGLPIYTMLVFLVIAIPLLRTRCPSDAIKFSRTILLFVLAATVEFFTRGCTPSFVLVLIASLAPLCNLV